ncbi:MAG: ABC transporter ATP-binding protein [Chloroflexi bacterium]|nr:ABC transporter ATP-binding protein [Chloroflexota bacterium]
MKLDVRDASFRYPTGVLALDGVSLMIGSGEAVALIGENGAGKTTLAKLLNGLLRPTAGSVLLDERDTRQHTPAQLSRFVGFVFQNPDDQLFARTVREEVAFGPRNQRLADAEVQARVDRALDEVELRAAADRHPYDLTSPERKLVALAAALAMQTPALILDEPTIGQDASGVARLGALVDRLHAEGRTLITITHDLDFCLEHFERVVVLAGGKILADGPGTDVLRRVDLLQQAQVEPPELVQLALGLGWDTMVRTPEGFADAWAEQRGAAERTRQDDHRAGRPAGRPQPED